jgi:peptide/nickel transport system substrate-binding protein
MEEATVRSVAMSRSALIAGIVFTTISLAACGRSGGEEGDATAATSAPPSATENQIAAAPRDALQDGGRLVWPISSMASNYNYHQLDGTDRDPAYITRALMPIIYLSDAAGIPRWNPDYLASEPTIVSEPRQVVTYRINPKAVWYDGTPITWEDFHWQWRASNGTDKAYQISGSSGYEDIESVVRGSDDREVIVTFKQKYADWQGNFYLLYPASTNKSAKVFNEGWRERPLTTGGPFKLDRIDQTSKTVTLVRNEKWWGEPARLETMVFRTIDPDAQIDALANGEIDALDVGPDANKFNRAKGISGTELRIAGGPNFRHFTINGTGPNLRDVKVRQAVAMGIDRVAIARSMLGPLGLQPMVLNNHIFMTNQAGYRDNSGEVGTYNPTRAAQLLDEAGWRLENGVRRKDGRNLELRCIIPTSVATSKQESELAQNMLGQLGIRMSITAVPIGDFFDKYVRPGQFDITVFSWIGTAFPIGSAKGLYAKPTIGPDGEQITQQNYARIGSDEIDALWAQANQELDRAKATEIANRIDALIWQEVHSLTLYQRPEIWAVRQGLANFGAFGFADVVFKNIGWMRQ